MDFGETQRQSQGMGERALRGRVGYDRFSQLGNNIFFILIKQPNFFFDQWALAKHFSHTCLSIN